MDDSHAQVKAAEGPEKMRYSHILMALFTFSMVALVLAAPLSVSPSHEGNRISGNEFAQASQSNISYVFLSSSLPGQSQFLTVSDNVSGALLYPDLAIRLISSSTTPYYIYINGKEESSGNVSGIRDIAYNISSGTSKVSISVQMGNKTWNYPNELVSSLPVSKYYGPRPPAALYTYFQYEEAIVKGFVAGIFGVAIAMFSGRKYILEKEKREAIFV
jgi:hypothetical protein